MPKGLFLGGLLPKFFSKIALSLVNYIAGPILLHRFVEFSNQAVESMRNLAFKEVGFRDFSFTPQNG